MNQTVTPQLQTNRDLYLAVNDLSEQHKDCDRSLEVYLLAVLNRATCIRELESLKLSEFYDVLASGFTYDPAPFDDAWREQYDNLPHEGNDYAGWRATVIRQIVDLREMEECGTLQKELRYFGVSAPRNSYWFNFDPSAYLECAMAGSFGGWHPGDDTGRQYVPGPVAVPSDDGSIQSVNPEDLPNPTYEVPVVSWDTFKRFVICGQIYE